MAPISPGKRGDGNVGVALQPARRRTDKMIGVRRRAGPSWIAACSKCSGGTIVVPRPTRAGVSGMNLTIRRKEYP
jgi:hypothetical protein